MKAISDIEQFICDKVNKITIRFNDGFEININYLFEWDFDFNRLETSYIYFKTYMINKELFNRFCIDDCINFIHIESKNIDIENSESDNIFTLDIPCDMRIKCLRTNGDMESATEMNVQLEGMVI